MRSSEARSAAVRASYDADCNASTSGRRIVSTASRKRRRSSVLIGAPGADKGTFWYAGADERSHAASLYLVRSSPKLFAFVAAESVA